MNGYPIKLIGGSQHGRNMTICGKLNCVEFSKPIKFDFLRMDIVSDISFAIQRYNPIYFNRSPLKYKQRHIYCLYGFENKSKFIKKIVERIKYDEYKKEHREYYERFQRYVFEK